MGGNIRDGWFLDRDEGPVFFILGSFFDPLIDEFFFTIIQFEQMIGRRHDVVGIFGDDAFPNKRFFRLARDNGGSILAISISSFPGVETEIGFPRIWVKSMAGEAVIRKERPDVGVEADGFGICDCGRGNQECGQASEHDLERSLNESREI